MGIYSDKSMGNVNNRINNAAPSDTMYSSARINFPKTPFPSIALANIRTKPLLSIQEFQGEYLAINGQTFWSNKAIKKIPQGYVGS